MNRVLVQVLFMIGVGALSPALQAALPQWLEPFPRSRVIQEKQLDAPDYRVMLGRIIKINRQIRTDRELRLEGALERTTWQLPVGQTPDDGFTHFRAGLQAAGADILFECSSRQCGASNLWANDLFETARLYGVDETQRYLAARRGSDYIVVYAIRRGNGRVFVNLDWLSEAGGSGPGEGDWSRTLAEQGYVSLPEWSQAPNETAQRLAALLKENPEYHLRLVLHQAGRDVELSLRQSRELAQRLRQQVVALGIGGERLEAYGVGPLAPSVLGERDRLLVIILGAEQ